jgi:DNA polymerase-3 subunit gamma/tau
MLTLLNEALLSHQDKVIDNLNTLVKKGKEIPKIINDLILFLRNVLLFKINQNEKYKIIDSIEFQSFALRISNQIIYHWLTLLNETIYNMKFTTQKRPLLEVTLIKMSDKMQIDYEGLVMRVNRLENQIKNGIKEKEVKDTFDLDKEVLEIQRNEDEYISLDILNIILNNGSKEYKKELQQSLLNIEPSGLIPSLMHSAQVGAASENGAIIVLDSLAKCNRLVKDEKYKEALSLIKGHYLPKEFYPIPSDTWSLILKQYVEEFQKGNKAPKLKNIEINVKKHIIENNNEEKVESNKILDMLSDIVIEEE